MAVFRNDFGEDRVVPHIGYQLVGVGQTVTVSDDEAEHWIAAGWTPVEQTPAVAPAKTTKAAAAVAEGGGS